MSTEIFGICGDTLGKLYVTDWTNAVIWSCATNKVNIVAGTFGTSGYTPDGSTARGSPINTPYGIVIDTMGYLYWAEERNYIIRKAATVCGILQTIAGMQGSFGNNGDGGPATSANLWYPWYLFVDNNGNIYFTDWENNNVRKITAASGIISLYAGGSYSPADSIAATSASVSSYLQGIAGDSNGNIYLSTQYTNYIYRVNSAGIINYFSGNGVSSNSLSYNSVAATSASIANVYGLVTDTSGNLYLAGYGQSNVAMVFYNPAPSIHPTWQPSPQPSYQPTWQPNCRP